MPEFLLEAYVSRDDPGVVEVGSARARRAAERLSWHGTPVRFLRTIFIPDDETCFYLFEAESVDAVRAVAERAELKVDRITESMGQPTGGTG